jgi:hypothetical protein
MMPHESCRNCSGDGKGGLWSQWAPTRPLASQCSVLDTVAQAAVDDEWVGRSCNVCLCASSRGPVIACCFQVGAGALGENGFMPSWLSIPGRCFVTCFSVKLLAWVRGLGLVLLHLNTHTGPPGPQPSKTKVCRPCATSLPSAHSDSVAGH